MAEAYAPSRFRESRGPDGQLSFVSDHRDRLALFADMPLWDLDRDAAVTIVELLGGPWTPKRRCVPRRQRWDDARVATRLSTFARLVSQVGARSSTATALGAGTATCRTCPTATAWSYTTTLDLTSGETFDPGGAMSFSNQLRYGWEHPHGDPVNTEESSGQASGGPAVLANCLDPVYGHAVLKLLGVQRLLERGNAAVIALVPAALVPIVPNGVAEAWLVRTPVRRLFGWVLELEEWVAEQLARFEDCRLAALPPHPHPSSFDLGRFVGEIDADALANRPSCSACAPIAGGAPTRRRSGAERRRACCAAARGLPAHKRDRRGGRGAWRPPRRGQ